MTFAFRAHLHNSFRVPQHSVTDEMIAVTIIIRDMCAISATRVSSRQICGSSRLRFLSGANLWLFTSGETSYDVQSRRTSKSVAKISRYRAYRDRSQEFSLFSQSSWRWFFSYNFLVIFFSYSSFLLTAIARDKIIERVVPSWKKEKKESRSTAKKEFLLASSLTRFAQDLFGRELSLGAAFLRAKLAKLDLKLEVQRSWNSGCVGCWAVSRARWRRGARKFPKRRTCTRCTITRKRPVTSLLSVNTSFPRYRLRRRVRPGVRSPICLTKIISLYNYNHKIPGTFLWAPSWRNVALSNNVVTVSSCKYDNKIFTSRVDALLSASSPSDSFYARKNVHRSRINLLQLFHKFIYPRKSVISSSRASHFFSKYFRNPNKFVEQIFAIVIL